MCRPNCLCVCVLFRCALGKGASQLHAVQAHKLSDELHMYHSHALAMSSLAAASAACCCCCSGGPVKAADGSTAGLPQ
jgi:hypothetical protein